MTQSNNMSSRTLTLERTFDAPIDLVWEAWTDPKHIAGWWAPKGMNVEVIEHNFEVGGTWKYSMMMPDGNAFVSEGAYSEIIKNALIVTSADFKPMTENVELRCEFEQNGNQTNFKFSVLHESEEYCQQQKEMGFYNGWASAFDRLAEMIK